LPASCDRARENGQDRRAGGEYRGKHQRAQSACRRLIARVAVRRHLVDQRRAIKAQQENGQPSYAPSAHGIDPNLAAVPDQVSRPGL